MQSPIMGTIMCTTGKKILFIFSSKFFSDTEHFYLNGDHLKTFSDKIDRIRAQIWSAKNKKTVILHSIFYLNLGTNLFYNRLKGPVHPISLYLMKYFYILNMSA